MSSGSWPMAPTQRKTGISDFIQDSTAMPEKGTKRKRGNQKSTKTNKQATVSVSAGPDRLSSLSPEILEMIASNVTQKSAVGAMCWTSKLFYRLMIHRLYHRIAVAAMFHAHIPKVIRTLEPHLSIKQKKQLKKEGKYKGQQEKYARGLDEDKIPICASQVRQMVIGASDPGRKHKYIVERYYEEALKNMTNIEILETRVVTNSMCKSLASLTKLKALAVLCQEMDQVDASPLASVRDLQQLIVELDYGQIARVGQSLIRNSISTLRSLAMHSNGYQHCFQGWDDNKPGDELDKTDTGRTIRFRSLRSLSMRGMSIDSEFVNVFRRLIRLSDLRELNIEHITDTDDLWWTFLTDTMMNYETSNIDVKLRDLSLYMESPYYRHSTAEEKQARLHLKCDFIKSFDCLTSLDLKSYGQYDPKEVTMNPGLSASLLEATLKHKNLKTLKISYVGITSGLEIPYLSAHTFSKLIDGLPELQDFEFPPDETQIDAISAALCRGKNLRSVKCFPHASWGAWPRPDELGINILSSILQAMTKSVDIVDGEDFVWEEHFKLKQLDLGHARWEVASQFGKRQKGEAAAKRIEVQVDGKTRYVVYREIKYPIYIHVGYDPTFGWVEKVEKDLD